MSFSHLSSNRHRFENTAKVQIITKRNSDILQEKSLYFPENITISFSEHTYRRKAKSSKVQKSM